MERILAPGLALLLCATGTSAQDPPDQEQAARVAEILAQLRDRAEDTELVRSLIPLGSAGLPAATLLIPQLKSRDPSHRLWVRAALASMGNGVIPVLMRNLTGDASIRGEIYQTLSAFETPSMELMELFLDARNDVELQKDLASRAWVEKQNGPEHIPMWKWALNGRLREPAIEVLEEVVLTEDWSTVLAALYPDLARRPGDREVALLGRIPEAGVPILIDLASTPGPARIQALGTLSLLGDRPPGARALFLHVLADVDDRSASGREAAAVAADALSRMGSGREEIVERMLAVHRAVENLQIRQAIVDALPNLGDAAAPGLPLVLAGLDSPDGARRLRAAVGALRIQAAQPAAVQVLRGLLGGEDPALRLSAVSLLAQAGDRGAALLDEVVALLEGDATILRLRALQCLAAMGTAAQPALPAVRELLADEDAQVRARAQRTIDAIGGGPLYST